MQILHRARTRLVGERTALINQLRGHCQIKLRAYDQAWLVVLSRCGLQGISLPKRSFSPNSIEIGRRSLSSKLSSDSAEMFMASVPRLTRRQGLAATACLFGLFDAQHRAQAQTEFFVAEAARQRDAALAAGDQPYGAVLVLDGRIIGTGGSRVISDNNPDAHAERVTLWDAQRRIGREDLTGAVIFATSPPCAICQRVLAKARVSSMRVGPEGREYGPPRGSTR